MSPPTTTPIILPVGPKPGWEFEDGNDDEEKQNISASCVLLHALRQSRQKWLSSSFPLFSTKSRNAKSIDHIPPPHTIQLRGRCELEIGPHIFSDTLFYEVHYLPPQSHQPLSTFQNYPSWQGKLPYSAPAHPASSATQTSSSKESSTPLISSLNTVTTITPALINQVNTAAASNPTLANLLQLAAAGLATPEQLKTLGLLIQSLATAETAHLMPPTPAVQPPPAPSMSVVSTTSPTPHVKEFDLVLEFRENPSERWIFPRGTVACERTVTPSMSGSMSYVTMSACLPFPKTKPSENAEADQTASSPDNEPLQVVNFRLRDPPLAVWDTISRWAGDEQKMEQNRLKLKAIKPAEHSYLGYQLPEGPLHAQLRTATALGYSMKSIKTSATSTRSRRKPPAKDKGGTSKPNGRENAASKRSRGARAERSSATQIQCQSCKNQDVPLIQGGRFCRPCVDSGRAMAATQPYRFTPYYVSTPTPTSQDVSQPTPTPPIAATQ